MPPIEDIQRQLIGAWRIMLGDADGLKRLDLSTDGFWNSFFAIVVALPALIVGWVGIAHELAPVPTEVGGRLFILIRLALVDLGTWTLPLVAFAAIAPLAGLADRFLPYVVSSNWVSALFVWMMLPPAILRLVAPSWSDAASTVSMILFMVTLVLSWRQTNIALGKGAAIATAVFAGVFVVSLLVLFALQSVFGLAMPDVPSR